MWSRSGEPRLGRVRSAACAIAAVTIALALGACGDSSSDETPASTGASTGDAAAAQTTVCNARDDIGKQVDQLKSLTPSTVSREAVAGSITAIKKDLDAISGAQGSLSGERRSELEAANKEFKAAVEDTAGQVVSSLTASDAKASLVTALQQLGTSYQKTFASLDCS
jgi:hypothetical protein